MERKGKERGFMYSIEFDVSGAKRDRRDQDQPILASRSHVHSAPRREMALLPTLSV